MACLGTSVSQFLAGKGAYGAAADPELAALIQRLPLAIGSRGDVELYERFVASGGP